MTDLVFVLGKNWLLSIAELIVHLQDMGYKCSVIDHSRSAIVMRVNETLDDGQIVDIQSHLGGCFKIGRLFWTYDRSIIREAFPTVGTINQDVRTDLKKVSWINMVWRKLGGRKVKFGVSSYATTLGKSTVDIRRFTRSMDEYIKRALIKAGAKKADYVIYDQPDRRDPRRLNTALWPKSIAKHNLLIRPNAEILAVFGEKHVYMAKTIVVYDSMLQQYRDESRPYVAAQVSTSPKICRTLLTMAGAKKGDTILDPFCGSGTLLMEAALLEMKCIGIDIEGNAVEGTKSNLRWFGKDLGAWVDYRIMKGDAREASILVQQIVDAIAFEPDLGPVSSKKMKRAEALKSINSLTELYRDVLRELTKILRPNGKIAMTIPVYITKDGEISINLKEMLRGTGLVYYPLLPNDVIKHSKAKKSELVIRTERPTIFERKQGQSIQRAIVMLGKP